MSKELPKWAEDEIKNVEFKEVEDVKRTGYILEIYDKDQKIDAQLYEPVEDGRHIITIDLPKEIKPSELMKGIVYEFFFKSYKGPLSKELIKFLKKELDLEMTAIYQFELTQVDSMDVDSLEGQDTEEE